MVTTLVIGTLLLATPPAPLPVNDAQETRVAYQEAKARAGRDPDANVRLALWCEAHDLGAERIKHLVIAVLTDPSHATARGLLGLVAYRGHWKRPEEVAADARTDASLQATLAEYNARREAMPETADAHWKLGVWCEQKGLQPEALAHFTAVTRLAPDRGDAWLRLGCRNYGGRWLSEAQIAAERAESDAQRQADARWTARLKRWWKDWLADKARRPEAEEELIEELEPRAVTTIQALFADGTPEQQGVAVQLLDRIDSPDASRALVRVATLGHSWEVRQQAAEALTRRDPHEVIEPLIGLMRAPIDVAVSSGIGPNAVAALRVEDERTILNKTYVQNTVRVPAVPGAPGRYNFGFLGAVMSPKAPRSAQQELSRDLRTVANRNAARGMINASARSVLAEITGQDLGSEPESWQRWLAEQRGYAYAPPTATSKRVVSRVSRYTQVQFARVGFHHNCFAKGTPVQTLFGPTPIETLRVGDRVLSEDPSTGALSFQPVVVVYHNPPNPTLKITLDREEIVSTPIHRFWRAGKGWALARDLKPGDSVRTLGGLARVAAVETDRVQPVYNLEVAAAHSFFVGRMGALVHDNSRIEPTSQPFDAAPPLAAVTHRAGEDGGKDRRTR